MARRVNTKTVTKRISLAAAVYAAEKIFYDTVALPAEYDEIDGISVHIGDDSGVANADYEVAVDDENGELMPWEHIGNIATAKNDGTTPDERYKSVGPYPVRGAGQLTVKGKVPAQTTTATLSLIFSIRIRKAETRTA